MIAAKEPNNAGVYDTLSDRDFRKLSDHIQQCYGVKMPPQKKLMLQCRLRKRLNALNIKTYKEYLELIFKENSHEEIQKMIDVVTTHKTDFFREKVHFDFINETIVPELVKRKNNTINVWSAGCSTGEEPYTMAISLSEAQANGREFDYKISASDISYESVQIAKKGVYRMDKVASIPMSIKKKYFLKNKDPKKPLAKVVKQLQERINFFTLNLLDKDYSVKEHFDIILCRNTLIYFERKTQEQVLSQLTRRLKSKGYLIIGHCESIIGMNLPLTQIKPTIFQRNF
jgi:chemotaxis protein methyltransferase CheR